MLFPWHPELVPKSRDFGYKTELMAGKKLGAGLEIGLCVGFRPTDLRGCVLGRTTDRPPGGVRASCSLVGELSSGNGDVSLITSLSFIWILLKKVDTIYFIVISCHMCGILHPLSFCSLTCFTYRLLIFLFPIHTIY